MKLLSVSSDARGILEIGRPRSRDTMRAAFTEEPGQLSEWHIYIIPVFSGWGILPSGARSCSSPLFSSNLFPRFLWADKIACGVVTTPRLCLLSLYSVRGPLSFLRRWCGVLLQSHMLTCGEPNDGNYNFPSMLEWGKQLYLQNGEFRGFFHASLVRLKAENVLKGLGIMPVQ